MSHHIIISALALLTFSAAAQAQQDRRFSAVAQPAYVDQRHPAANPAAYDIDRSRGSFGASSAAAVAHTLGY